jgi:hypothetical protein
MLFINDSNSEENAIMSKMSQYFMDQPYDDQENQSGINDDPDHQVWSDQQDEQDIECQDSEEPF